MAMSQAGGLKLGAKVVIEWLRTHGYKGTHLYSDGEHSMKALIQLIIRNREEKTTYAHSPARSHQSMDSLNQMAKMVGGQLRTCSYDMEAKLGMTIVPDMVVYAWIARSVSFMLTRYHIRGSGRTAHEKPRTLRIDPRWASSVRR